MSIHQHHSQTPFIRKLNHILSQSSYSSVISWDQTGTMIDIFDQKRIQTDILPKFFRHSKFQSFIRQLNLYGFKKMKKNDCHRFKHADIMKGNSLFSIKSQRKLKKDLQKSDFFVDQIQINGQNKEKINQINTNNQNNKVQEEIKKQNFQVKNLQQFSSMNFLINPQNLTFIYQNPLGMYLNNSPHQNMYLPLVNNFQTNGLQNRNFSNFNNIFFYN